MNKQKSNKANATIPVKRTPGDKISAIRLTPPELAPNPNQIWATALFNDRLYFAWMTFSPENGSVFQRILYYEQPANSWVTCYRYASRKQKIPTNSQTQRLPPFATASMIDNQLFFHFHTSQYQATLQSADGTTFTKQPKGQMMPHTPNPAWAQALASKPAGIPHLPRLVASHGNTMFAAVDDTRRGASVYALEPDSGTNPPKWHGLLDQGAARYTGNPYVLAADIWKNHLYLILGNETKNHSPGPYQGFEILSLPLHATKPDWTLIAGIPRVTAQGFKVPLSEFGPGMNEFDPHDFLFLQPTTNYLVLGTYSELNGLTCWFSKDGTRWKQHVDLRLAGTSPIRAAQTFAHAGGIYLTAHAVDPNLGDSADIWHIPC